LSRTTLTPREAAFVLDETPKSITKLLDTYFEKGRVAKRGGVPVRYLTESDLLIILVLQDAKEVLSARGKKGLLDAIFSSIARPNTHTVHFGALTRLDNGIDEGCILVGTAMGGPHGHRHAGRVAGFDFDACGQ
jgi:hypothetical protein